MGRLGRRLRPPGGPGLQRREADVRAIAGPPQRDAPLPLGDPPEGSLRATGAGRASAGKLDGKNISFLVVDKLHEWNLDTICGREYKKGQRIAAGEEKNPRYLFRWFQALEVADYRQEETWRAANPSYGELVTTDQLADKVANAPQAQFERYFLNRWTWLPAGTSDACKVGRFEFDSELPLYSAIEAATKECSTAVVLAQWQGEKLRLRARIWERPRDMSGSPIQDWVLPLAEVEQHLHDLDRDYDFHFGIDPRFLERTRQVLEADGLSVEEVRSQTRAWCRQASRSMSWSSRAMSSTRATLRSRATSRAPSRARLSAAAGGCPRGGVERRWTRRCAGGGATDSRLG